LQHIIGNIVGDVTFSQLNAACFWFGFVIKDLTNGENANAESVFQAGIVVAISKRCLRVLGITSYLAYAVSLGYKQPYRTITFQAELYTLLSFKFGAEQHGSRKCTPQKNSIKHRKAMLLPGGFYNIGCFNDRYFKMAIGADAFDKPVFLNKIFFRNHKRHY